MSNAIDRRTFLASAPRWLFGEMKVLMSGVAALAWHASEEQERAAYHQIALLDISRCLAWSGTDCQTCYLACPKREKAMTIEAGKPAIVTSVCDGCGVCIGVCRSVNDLEAIQLVDVAPHRVTT